MHSIHTPEQVKINPQGNLNEFLIKRVNAAGHKTLVELKDDTTGAWTPLSARDFEERVRALAKGFIAKGIQPGQRIGIMSRTSVEWALLDWAIWSAGAVSVPIYETSSSEQVQWILSDAEIKILVLETAEHFELATQLKNAGQEFEIITLNNGGLNDLSDAGLDISDTEVETRRTLASNDDLATIIYTSGTTGKPKGAELTHGNFYSLSLNASAALPEIVLAPGARTLLFIPLAHVFARFISVLIMSSDIVVGYCPDIKDLVEDLGTFKPTFILAVPRVFEKVYNSAEQKAAMNGKRRIFHWATRTAIAYSRSLDTTSGPSFSLRAQHRLADRLVYAKLRKLLGGDAKYAISGGAALGERLGHFYRGIGLIVLEGYGLTETTAPICVNLPANSKIGTVGIPLPGLSVKVDDSSEILVKGPSIFKNYHNNPDASATSFDGEWFKTGDIGQLDAEGYLTITGRKKELIVTAGGKNVAPTILEDRVRAHPLISQVVVVGDGQPFIAALITIDTEGLDGWLKSHNRSALTIKEAISDPEVLASIETAIARANKAVSKAESIRKFKILENDFTQQNGYLTPSLKVKRTLVIRDFESEINNLYASVKRLSD